MNFRQRKELIQKRQDRLIAFFDAVLAIAITMLALEIVVPAFGTGNPVEIETFFQTFTGYLISFISLGVLWYLHSGYIAVYGLTGKGSEVALHFVMMFLITLFQPAAKALNQYRGDGLVRALYLAVFIGMNLLNVLMLVILKRRNDHITTREDALRGRLKDLYDAEADGASEQEKLAQMIAFYVNRPDAAMENFKGRMSEAQLAEIEEHQNERAARYRFTILSTAALTVSVVAAVVAMLFSIPMCYLCLLMGIVAIGVIRWRENGNTRKEAVQ